MDEILALQEELMKIQSSSSKHSLSERNCVDLVLKLIDLKKVEVIGTISGVREYVTPSELDKEIIETIESTGGRITYEELQSLLNIDINYIEAHVKILIQNNSNYQMLNSQTIVTLKYVDDVISQCRDLIKEKGEISIGSLANIIDLPIDFLSNLLESRLKGDNSVYSRNGKFYSNEFYNQEKCKLLGTIRGCTIPTLLSTLYSLSDVESSFGDDILNDLMKNNCLWGNILNQLEYVPSIFIKNQKQAVFDYYNSNNYMEFSRAEDLRIDNPIKYFESNFNDCIILSSCVCSTEIYTNLEHRIEELYSEMNVLDVRTILPDVFTIEDCSILIRKYPGIKDKYDSSSGSSSVKDKCELILCNDVFIIPSKYIQSLISLFIKPAEEGAAKYIKEMEEFGRQNDSSNVDEEDNYYSDEENTSSNKKGKKGKGGGKKKGKGDTPKEKNDKSNKKSMKMKKPSLLTIKEIESILRSISFFIIKINSISLIQFYNKIQSEVIEFISESLYNDVYDLYSHALSEMKITQSSSSNSVSKKALSKEFNNIFSGIFSDMLLYQKCINELSRTISPDEPYMKAIISCYCSGYIKSCIISFITYTAIQYDVTLPEGAENIVDVLQAKTIVKLFPMKIQSHFLQLFDFLKKKDINTIITYIQDHSDDLLLTIPKFDKKSEKQLLFKHRMQILEELKNSGIDDFHFIQNHIQLLYILNLKSLPPVMERTEYLLSLLIPVKSFLSEEMYEMFNSILTTDPLSLTAEQKEKILEISHHESKKTEE